jgi:hypothetical protein
LAVVNTPVGAVPPWVTTVAIAVRPSEEQAIVFQYPVGASVAAQLLPASSEKYREPGPLPPTYTTDRSVDVATEIHGPNVPSGWFRRAVIVGTPPDTLTEYTNVLFTAYPLLPEVISYHVDSVLTSGVQVIVA